jgi:hypothetical protein
MPLLFAVTGFFYLEMKNSNAAMVKVIETVFGIALSLAAMAGLSILFLDLPAISNAIWISISLFISLGLISYLYWKHKSLRLYWLVTGILVFRIGFDLIILPVRVYESKGVESRDLAYSIAGQTSGEELYYWWDPDKEATGYYGRRLTSYRFSYYLSIARDEIVKTITEREEGAWFITPAWNINRDEIEVRLEFQPVGNESPVLLFQFKNPDEAR